MFFCWEEFTVNCAHSQRIKSESNNSLDPLSALFTGVDIRTEGTDVDGCIDSRGVVSNTSEVVDTY